MGPRQVSVIERVFLVGGHPDYKSYYSKICDLIGHFVLASQGLLGHCTYVMEIMS